MAESINLEKVKATLGKLIDVLRDSHQGFLDLEKNLQDHDARAHFLKETQERANFSGELENELHRLGVKDVHQSGMVSGKVHRTWGELKAKLGGGDHTLLETAEQGEDEAKKAYADTLNQELPLPVRQLVAEQQAHVLTSHDFVKSHRDALAAK